MVFSVGSVVYFIILSALFSSLLVGIVGRCLGWSDQSAPIKAVIKAKTKKETKAQEKIKQANILKELEATKNQLEAAKSRAEYLENRLNYTQAELLFVKKKQVKDLTRKSKARASVHFIELDTQKSASLNDVDLAHMVAILDCPDEEYSNQLDSSTFDAPVKISSNSFRYRNNLNDEFRKKQSERELIKESKIEDHREGKSLVGDIELTSEGRVVSTSTLSSHSSSHQENSNEPPPEVYHHRHHHSRNSHRDRPSHSKYGSNKGSGDVEEESNPHVSNSTPYSLHDIELGESDDVSEDPSQSRRSYSPPHPSSRSRSDSHSPPPSRGKYNDTDEEMREFAGLGRRAQRAARPPPKKKQEEQEAATVERRVRKKKRRPPQVSEMTFDI